MTRTAAGTIATAAVIALLAVGLGAWAPWTKDDPDQVSRWQPTYAALCDATDRANAGKATAAQRLFLDRAHDPLHSLGDIVSNQNRKAAARLLEAKEAVESSTDATPKQLGSLLTDLAATTRTAARVAGEPISSTCTGG